MSFNSIEFLIFLLLVLVVHRILPHKFRWIWLLSASYYFYMSWNAWLIFLIVGTTLVSYGAGRMIHKFENSSVRKFLLALTIVVCLGVLAFFKYFNFLLSSVQSVIKIFSLNFDGITLDILLPIGISFYTFQTLSYVIDVYRKKIIPEKHFGYYALYVSYFPQLVAGPIERFDNLIPQLKSDIKATREDVVVGLRLMLCGFFKKVAVADFIGAFVNSAFGSLQGANGFSLWIAAILFTVQIYCDFSGYSDIASGCARMMGVKLMKNFDRPFLATSIKEYGSRWHISLNSWFMEYLYFPFGGGKKGKFRKYLNILIVFSLSGLWHGASWTFVIWGATIGAYTILEDILRPVYRKACKKLSIDNTNAAVKMLRRFVVILLVGLCSVFFRAQSVPDAGLILTKMFTDFGFGAQYVSVTMKALSMNLLDIIQLAVTLVIMSAGYAMCYPKDGGLFSLQASDKSAAAVRWSCYIFYIAAIAVMWIIAVSNNDASAFIYFQF